MGKILDMTSLMRTGTHRKDEDEDAVVAEVVLRDPRPVAELAQEVEPDEPERESKSRYRLDHII